MRNYAFKIAAASTGSLLDLLKLHLTDANLAARYAFNKRASKVVAPIAVFQRLITSIFREKKEAYPSMHKLFVALSIGAIAPTAKQLNRFGIDLCKVLEYPDFPNESDVRECLSFLADKWENENPFLSAQMFAEAEAAEAEAAKTEAVTEVAVEAASN